MFDFNILLYIYSVMGVKCNVNLRFIAYKMTNVKYIISFYDLIVPYLYAVEM